ncbi:MAG TPA: hypothetical protein DDZ42_15760 [Candidatus Rokubacteria bacterium]|nr:MAG: hypothetical protein A2050_15945 [Candidatus Rokubacteria bacterium GWA2_73_35]HBH03349.1 hypothetical protein [Candidatus Rokubacteria bacterium]
MQDGERPLLVVVPRTGLEACRSLGLALGEDSTVQVIVDRRLTDRRVRADTHQPERRRGDRRLRSDAEADFRAGRWIAVARAAGRIDFSDPDARAILFFCCSQHVVPCESCQNTYRLGWIARAGSDAFPCPLCGSDLTPIVVAHAQTCRYWVDREAGAERRERPAQAATG